MQHTSIFVVALASLVVSSYATDAPPLLGTTYTRSPSSYPDWELSPPTATMADPADEVWPWASVADEEAVVTQTPEPTFERDYEWKVSSESGWSSTVEYDDTPTRRIEPREHYLIRVWDDGTVPEEKPVQTAKTATKA